MLGGRRTPLIWLLHCLLLALPRCRWMGSGEYIQMSGRAGRRGKDDRGIAIMMVDDQLDEPTCRCAQHGGWRACVCVGCPRVCSRRAVLDEARVRWWHAANGQEHVCKCAVASLWR